MGERAQIELREGERKKGSLPLHAKVSEVAGLQVYMRPESLSAFVGESPSVSMAMLSVDAAALDDVIQRLQKMPKIAGITRRDVMLARFQEQTATSISVMTFFTTFFASIIALGVVYNSARIALSMRERELASLRVLGFTRGEISGILLGELAIQVLAALPPGFVFGRLMAEGIARGVDPERFRLPLTISIQTYAFAATVTLVAGALSALLVRRKLDHLDLIGVLKSRE